MGSYFFLREPLGAFLDSFFSHQPPPMARSGRFEDEGSGSHVTARRNEREAIYLSYTDRHPRPPQSTTAQARKLYKVNQ